MPTLKHLILTWTHESIPTTDDLRHNVVNKSLLTKLKICKGTGPDWSDLVPLLKTLSCELVDGHMELCVLLEMLEPCCTTPHPLKTTKFWCSDDKCSNLRAALQVLQLEVIIADGENLRTEIYMLWLVSPFFLVCTYPCISIDVDLQSIDYCLWDNVVAISIGLW